VTPERLRDRPVGSRSIRVQRVTGHTDSGRDVSVPDCEKVSFPSWSMARLSGLLKADPTGRPVTRSIVLLLTNTEILFRSRSRR